MSGAPRTITATTPTTCACCGGGSNCGLECQFKAGFAELCGYSEFTEPSLPPKKYKRKTITGSMVKCVYARNNCLEESCSSGLSQSYSGSGTGPDAFGNPGKVSGSGTLTPVRFDSDTNKWVYLAVATAVYPLQTHPDDPPPGPVTARLVVSPSTGGTFRVNNGATTVLQGCTGSTHRTYGVAVEANAGGFVVIPATSGSMEPPANGASISSTRDEWNVVCSYAPNLPDACLASVVTDTSVHYDNDSHGTCPGPDGTPATVSLGCEVGYPDDNVDVVSEPATRVTAGNGNCVADPIIANRWNIYDGEVTETLNDEDTEEDAEDRVTSTVGWTFSANCLETYAFRTDRGEDQFSFGFRKVQTRAVMTDLIEGNTYNLVIGFYRRAFGAGPTDPWIFFGTQETTFIAGPNDGSGHQRSDWFDIPSASGFSTRAQTCNVEPVP